jgi:hypothetical protein
METLTASLATRTLEHKLGRDFRDHVSNLEDHDGEEVLSGAETDICVHACDFGIANVGAVLVATHELRPLYKLGA